MKSLDPTTIRLSDTLLLSDMMGCSSVYKHGYKNKFYDTDRDKLKEGRYLAETIDGLQESLGPVYICYGYISPELSRKIVKYQDPNKPSYHRWDAGAAADLYFYEGLIGSSPAKMAAYIDDNYDYSRMITYSESEWVCFATKTGENTPRKAFYENRYVIGAKKPKFIKYSENKAKREEQKRQIDPEEDWRGQGHPSYHLGGKKGLEHYKMRKYSHFSDFLYQKRLVNRGIPNLPPFHDHEWLYRWTLCAIRAAVVVEKIAEEWGSRVSIVSAYDSTDEKHLWHDCMTMELVLPRTVDSNDVAHYLSGLPILSTVRSLTHKGETHIRVRSNPL